MTKFENHLKSSLDSYQPEFNPADWADMNSRLDKLSAGKAPSQLGKGLWIAASVVAIAGLTYYFSANNSETQPTDKTIAQNQTSATNSDGEDNAVVNEEAENQHSAARLPDRQVGNLFAGQAGQQPENNTTLNSEKVVVQNTTNENKTNSSEKAEVPVESKTAPEQNQHVNTQPEAASVVKATFRTDVNKVCAGAPVQFTADNSASDCSYKWYFGDGETSAEVNPSHIYKTAGTFSPRLKVTSNKDKKSDEQKNTVTVVASPSVDMTYRVSEENKLAVAFDAEAAKVTDWKWDFGDKKTSSEQNPSHTFAKYGTYKVMVTAKNSVGCSTTIGRDVEVKNTITIFAPNAFSPDGDGLNDTWLPTFDDDFNFNLTVYDKSNSVVFTSSDRNNPWQGVNPKTGAVVKSGETFTWIAVVKDKTGAASTHKGNITIK